MLTLTLVRHAKSSWDDINLKDIDRPLNDRGKKQTNLMAEFLIGKGVKPDLILCSSAKRARQTLNRLLKLWRCDAEVIFDSRLYMASADDFAALLDEYGANRRHIMLIGHNPGLHMLAYSLAVKGRKETLKALTEKFPTLAIASLKLNGEKWKKTMEGELDFYVTPKLVAE